MVIVDGQRRYVEVNRPAQSALGGTRAELRQLRVDDLTPRSHWPEMEASWKRLIETGLLHGGPSEGEEAERGYLGVTFFGVANVLPGLHLIAFAPPGWPENELVVEREDTSRPVPSLTPRELELLELAAEGHSGPSIAAQLGISPATVRTHFDNLYAKLGVKDRAAAVASAIRLGLIA
jgi:DNA-binding CsgD family transcriptional regulator